MKILFRCKKMHADTIAKKGEVSIYCFHHELRFSGKKRLLTGGPPGAPFGYSHSVNFGGTVKSDKSAGITGSCFLLLLPSMPFISCGVRIAVSTAGGSFAIAVW